MAEGGVRRAGVPLDVDPYDPRLDLLRSSWAVDMPQRMPWFEEFRTSENIEDRRRDVPEYPQIQNKPMDLGPILEFIFGTPQAAAMPPSEHELGPSAAGSLMSKEAGLYDIGSTLMKTPQEIERIRRLRSQSKGGGEYE